MHPQNIGRYQVKQQLGRGGMGAVYQAYDPRFGRNIAIKVLPQEFLNDPALRTRFEREAHIIAALEHPAIVPVYDFGEENGQHYLVMRYMAGGSLADRLSGGPLSLKETIGILQRLAPALDMAHQRGVIHRDLKPANILFDEQGNPYIADFGIAKIAEATISLTISGVVGTPAYMSPEQAQGDVVLDGRSDIYALGAMLFEMLSGRQPYQATTPLSLAMKHVLDPVPHIREVAPSLSSAIDQVLQQAMAKRREDRFSTANALVNALAAAGAGQAAVLPSGKPASATPSRASTPPPPSKSLPPRSQSWWRGWPIWLVAGLLIVIIALAAVGIGSIDRTIGSAVTQPTQRTATMYSAATALTAKALVALTGTPGFAVEIAPTFTITALPSPTSSVAPYIATQTTRPLATTPPTSTPAPTATAVQPTSTPLPAATAVPPTITPLPQLSFQPVSISQVANASTQEGYSSPPLGTVELGGVLFNLPQGTNSVTTQADPLPNNPQQITLDVDFPEPQQVHLLITGGNLYSRFAGQQIGAVRLRFSGEPAFSAPLIAGQNIREWKLLDDQTVSSTTSPSVREVWSTASNHGGTGIIDMLSINMEEAYRADRLVGIDVIDTSADTVGSLDPAINLIGVTVLAR